MAVRQTPPKTYWLWIIIFGGALGTAVYLFAEIIPDLGLLRSSFQGISRQSRIKALELQILDNPSAGNLEELADLYFDKKNYAQAREALNRAIAARADSPCFLLARQVRSSHGRLCRRDSRPGIRRRQRSPIRLHYCTAGVLADACARTGERQKADYYFALATANSNTPETLFNYASYLKQSGKKEEGREWTAKLAAKKKTLPRYMQRIERSWFPSAKTLERELAT